MQFSSCRPESSPSRQRLRRAHAATLRIVRRHPQSEFERQVHELRARHPLAASHSPRPHRVAGAAPKPHSAVLELHALLDRHFAPHELAREERAYADRGDEDQAREGAQPRDAADGVLGRRLLVVRHRRHADGLRPARSRCCSRRRRDRRDAARPELRVWRRPRSRVSLACSREPPAEGAARGVMEKSISAQRAKVRRSPCAAGATSGA